MENLNQKSEDSIQNSRSIYERITGSIMLKFVVIFFLTLIMLIPMNLIDNLISERKMRELNVSSEIAAKWGKDQVIVSPVVAVPYQEIKEAVEQTSDGKNQLLRTVETKWAYLLPADVAVNAIVNPKPLKRGIYHTIVYNSRVKITGDFSPFDLLKLDISAEKLKWNQAKLIFGIQDVKGLSENPEIRWGDQNMQLTKSNYELQPFTENLMVDLHLDNNEDLIKNFEINFEIRGSKSLNFLPLAKQTKIEASGSWGNPSFNGVNLPEEREVDNDSFKASWNIPSFSRKLPQQWTGKSLNFYDFQGIDLSSDDSPSGKSTIYSDATSSYANDGSNTISSDNDMVQINFLPSVNNYQKTTRVIKYGFLVVALSFVSLLFMEIIKKQRVHIIQYVLIGFAMVLFYALLLAISEHLGFDFAYLIAAFATIVLIASFVKAITKQMMSALLFGGILFVFYVFIYILMQLRDYSLIVGTIGVFIILASLMRLSTKIDWYQFDKR